jgi:hypothetical protein|tara:strand:+ start:1209 stop:1343 length:135 start_codon:yes stop_codon:yes gene_type:complete
MLFTFSKFWQVILANTAALLFLNLAGFEITLVLLLCTMLVILAD